jgi:hypothetical protein
MRRFLYVGALLLFALLISHAKTSRDREGVKESILSGRAEPAFSSQGSTRFQEFQAYFQLRREVALFSVSGVRFGRIRDLKVNARGHFLITDDVVPVVCEIDEEGRLVQKIGNVGRGPGEYLSPRAIDLDKDGNIFILDSKQSRILIFDPNGVFVRSLNLGRPASDFLVQQSGGIVIFHPMTPKTLLFLSPSGNLIKQAAENALRYAVAGGKITQDAKGNILEMRPTSFEIRIFSAEGRYLYSIGEKPKGFQTLSKPPTAYESLDDLERAWTPMTGIYFLAESDLVISQMRVSNPPSSPTFFITLYESSGKVFASNIALPSYIIGTNNRDTIFILKEARQQNLREREGFVLCEYSFTATAR